MNYAQALLIAADHAPHLLVDLEVKGQPHICVRTSAKGAPFSIMLPESTDDAEADKKRLTDALDAATKHLGVGK
jgi:hypothetical protein